MLSYQESEAEGGREGGGRGGGGRGEEERPGGQEQTENLRDGDLSHFIC